MPALVLDPVLSLGGCYVCLIIFVAGLDFCLFVVPVMILPTALIMAAAAGSEAVVRVFWLAVVIAVLFGKRLSAT